MTVYKNPRVDSIPSDLPNLGVQMVTPFFLYTCAFSNPISVKMKSPDMQPAARAAWACVCRFFDYFGSTVTPKISNPCIKHCSSYHFRASHGWLHRLANHGRADTTFLLIGEDGLWCESRFAIRPLRYCRRLNFFDLFAFHGKSTFAIADGDVMTYGYAFYEILAHNNQEY